MISLRQVFSHSSPLAHRPIDCVSLSVSLRLLPGREQVQHIQSTELFEHALQRPPAAHAEPEYGERLLEDLILTECTATLVCTTYNSWRDTLQNQQPELNNYCSLPLFLQVLTFCPTQLGHFRGVLKLSLGSDILVVPIRVVGEASTVGVKQPRCGSVWWNPPSFFSIINDETKELATLFRVFDGSRALNL